jgi:LPXTG-motif cell wall-anchored protein
LKRLLTCVILALAGGLIFVSIASAQAATKVNVSLSEFKVAMTDTTLAAGTKVTYVITNNGKITHEMVLEKEGVTDEPLEFNGTGQEAEDIEPGTTRTVEWTIPEAGKYQLACHVEGHYEAGMKTAFSTEIAAAPAAPAAQTIATAPAAQTIAATAQLPKTAGEDYWWPIAMIVVSLAVLVGGMLLRRRMK